MGLASLKEKFDLRAIDTRLMRGVWVAHWWAQLGVVFSLWIEIVLLTDSFGSLRAWLPDCVPPDLGELDDVVFTISHFTLTCL